jgi:transcriptional regulator with GAF, ATPase, and Fis domain
VEIGWRKTLFVLAGVLALAYALVVLCYVPFAPDIGLRCAFTPVIKEVDASFLAAVDHPEKGDTLVAVGDYPIESSPRLWAQVLLHRALTKLEGKEGPGIRQGPHGEQQVLVKYRHQPGGELLDAWLPVRRLPFRELIPSLLWFLLKVGLFLVGALVFWKRPADKSAAQFFLLCIVTLGAYLGGYHWVRIATQPVLLLVFMVCAVLLPAVSLHFYLIFPRPKEFLRRYGRGAWLVIYGLPVGFLVALVYCYFQLRELFHQSPEGIAAAWGTLRVAILVYLVVASLWYLASVVSLVHSYRAAADATARNQVKWIMFGSLLALVPIGYTLYLIEAKPDDFGAGAARLPMFAASVCFTAAFAVSITRYRLMQLDQLVSSGATYFLISSVAGVVYYAVFAGLLIAGSRVFERPLAQAFSVSATALVVLVVLNLLRNRFKRALDRAFYREKYQLDRTLRRMGQAIEQLVDPPTLARRLLQASAEVLNVSRGAVYLREGEPPLYRLAGHLGPAPSLTELSSGCPLVEVLQGRGALVVRPGPGPEGDPALRQLRFLGGEVAHALAHEGRLLALLVLGPKDRGLFGAEDLNLLGAFAQFTALALDSAQGHRTIEALNRDLRAKVEKISEQQRRILALQSQLLRQSSRDNAEDKNGALAAVPSETPDSAPALPPARPGSILGSGPVVRQLLETVRKVSASQSAVLIQGENGTGKGLLARALHDHGPRAGKPFVQVHCSALSPGLLESELFGHVKGAFTGAHRDKVGRFELANGGTLFLDEIGDISPDVQTKLLRVLQEKTFERVGSSEPLRADVRVIAASHQDLDELINQGRFRQDLYYRLRVIDIAVPPLRERREDIPELALHFLRSYGQRCGKAGLQIDDDALAVLKACRWPGNVRQLENAIERAVVLAEGETITPQELPQELLREVAEQGPPADGERSDGQPAPPARSVGVRAERAERDRRERERLVRALAATGGNKAEAARALGLARSTFVSRLNKYGLS